MFHLTVGTANVDQALAAVPWVDPDQVLAVNTNDLILAKGFEHVLASYAGSATCERARYSSLALQKRLALPDILPVNVGAEPVSPTPMDARWHAPIVLPASDRLQLHVENEGAGAAERVSTGVWLGDGPVRPAKNVDWTPVIATTTASALTANAWNSRTLTMAQTLPPGTYAVGGLRARSTSLIFARLIFPGQAYRPGCIGYDNAGDIEREEFRRGGLGIWGTFSHDAPPTIELFATAADNEVQECVLDIARVSGNGR